MIFDLEIYTLPKHDCITWWADQEDTGSLSYVDLPNVSIFPDTNKTGTFVIISSKQDI